MGDETTPEERVAADIATVEDKDLSISVEVLVEAGLKAATGRGAEDWSAVAKHLAVFKIHSGLLEREGFVTALDAFVCAVNAGAEETARAKGEELQGVAYGIQLLAEQD